MNRTMKSFRISLLAAMLIIGGAFAWAAKVDKTISIKVGSKTRKYRLYVPNNVKENTALVFCLHGTGGSSDNKQPAFDAIANSDSIIVVYGHGENVYFPFFGMSLPGWNSTGEWSGDIDYILAIIEDVASKYSIDRNRIYCRGFSNGGMMTYTVANLLGDVFAAYASISGYPINEFHLHHTGARPVPFLHIHGTNDDLVKSAFVSKIIDNMVARNGCNPVPETTTKSGKFTKKVYAAGEGGFPIVFYSINGMGHMPETNNTEEGNASKTMWNFMKQYTLDSPCDTTLKWRPCIETEGWTPTSHGWTINSGTTICSFGKDQNTNSNANVYYSLQFIKGDYRLTFDAIGEAGKQVTVQLKHRAGKKDVVFKKTVEVDSNRSIEFNIPDEWAEFNISFTKDDAADDITISGIEIHSYVPDPAAISDMYAHPASHPFGIYKLSGIQTNHPNHGINIIDGRKVLVK